MDPKQPAPTKHPSLTRRETLAAVALVGAGLGVAALRPAPRVYAGTPYRTRGTPDTTNATDAIYADGGARSLLALRPRGRGYVARLTMGVQA